MVTLLTGLFQRVTWQEIYHEKLTEYFAFKNARKDMQPCSFAPIFGKNMSMAMYYSRLWAEVWFFFRRNTIKIGKKLVVRIP